VPVTVDRSLRLSEDQYFPVARPKSGIAIHHTVGGSAESTFRWWQVDRTGSGRHKRVATAYLVDRDGTVFEVFDPGAWAYQFGLTWPDAERLRFEQRFVGIEIASAGGLTEREGGLHAAGHVWRRAQRAREQAFDAGRVWRGYRWFDRYARRQLDAVGQLVDQLCARFTISRRYPDPPFEYYGRALSDFEGVIGHAMVRSDKSDPAPDPRLWETLAQLAALRPVPVPPSARPHAAE
jgi:hypothetical protein